MNLSEKLAAQFRSFLKIHANLVRSPKNYELFPQNLVYVPVTGFHCNMPKSSTTRSHNISNNTKIRKYIFTVSFSVLIFT